MGGCVPVPAYTKCVLWISQLVASMANVRSSGLKVLFNLTLLIQSTMAIEDTAQNSSVQEVDDMLEESRNEELKLALLKKDQAKTDLRALQQQARFNKDLLRQSMLQCKRANFHIYALEQHCQGVHVAMPCAGCHGHRSSKLTLIW